MNNSNQTNGTALAGKVVVLTNLRKIPKSCSVCKYYDTFGAGRGRISDGCCTAGGRPYQDRTTMVSKERMANCPLRKVEGGGDYEDC